MRLRLLVDFQDELQREFGRLAAVTVDEPYVNGALRAGLGDASRSFRTSTGRSPRSSTCSELTDETHRPFLPFTFVRIPGSSSGGSGAASGTGAIRPRMSCASSCARSSRAAELRPPGCLGVRRRPPPDAGIDAPVVWIRESSDGNELWRGVHEGPVPEVGAELGWSMVDGRPWIVRRIEEGGERRST